MKKTNILYWTFTGLFSALMLSSGIPNFMATADWVNIFEGLGYPAYLLPFLGLAKILGAVMILIPGWPRLKEWAYAGLFFDLIGATYSVIMVEGFNPPVAGMLVFFGLWALSYVYYHKRRKAMETHGINRSSVVTA